MVSNSYLFFKESNLLSFHTFVLLQYVGAAAACQGRAQIEAETETEGRADKTTSLLLSNGPIE